jgi:hypothetical protein
MYFQKTILMAGIFGASAVWVTAADARNIIAARPLILVAQNVSQNSPSLDTGTVNQDAASADANSTDAQPVADTLAQLGAPLTNIDFLTLCDNAGGENSTELAAALEGRKVIASFPAGSYSIPDHQLTGMAAIRVGANARDIFIETDTAYTKVPATLSKGQTLAVTGVMHNNFFYGNLIENCVISITAAKIVVTGFQ